MNVTFQPKACNDCHDLMQKLCFNDVTLASVKGMISSRIQRIEFIFGI